MIPDQKLGLAARRLGAVLEPVAGQVYFAPECHEGYARLGFAPSTRQINGVAMPDGPAYFTSRGSVMGQVPGSVVAAAFAVFNPDVVIPSVDFGWSITDSQTICTARDQGAIAHLHRLLGPDPAGAKRAAEILQIIVDRLRPEGRPLFAGLLSCSLPEDPIGKVWRLADTVREFRGDAHTAAWISAGIDATEIGLLTELYWGLPLRSYARTRGWTNEQFDQATERLTQRGLIGGDGGFTAEGRKVREAIEVATDAQIFPALEHAGDALSELFDIVAPWGLTIRQGAGYPQSGPHDLAGQSNS